MSQQPQQLPQTLLYVGQEEDRNYLPKLKSYVGNSTVFIRLMPKELTIAEILLYCKQKNITGVFTNHPSLLAKLTQKDKPSLANFAGSMFTRSSVEFLIIPPLDHLWKVKHGQFLMRRFLSKLVSPWEWKAEPKFEWEMITPATYQATLDVMNQAILIAVDIETTKHNLGISLCGYSAVLPDPSHPSGIKIKSYVLDVTDMWAVSVMRSLNWDIKAPKVLQNGKYDCAYFFRYNAPLYNFLFDTAAFFHAWLAELPKDLAYLSAYFIRESVYWKDMAKESDGDHYTYCMYNARDIHATALVFIRMLEQAPEWAVRNYLQKFPLVFPSHMCEMTGIKRDMAKLKEVSTVVSANIEKDNTRLSKILGVSNFNVASPKQMKQLLTILGCSDLESADEKHLEMAAYRHPLNRFIVDIILEIRGNRKLASTYLVEGKEFNDDATGRKTDRILYSISPYGTDTGRNASSESSFWCGLQVQNIPRGKEVKSTLIADDGFRLYEADLEQAESRDTAFIAGDTKLIAAVTGTKDFHSVNGSSFFGVPYESIYCDIARKTLNKMLRDLAKRVNHGANYNMGANTLVATMGEAKIREAGKLLGLPSWWESKKIAEHLLAAFHRTYPSLQGSYYPSVIQEIVTTQMLSSKALHLSTSASTSYDPAKWYADTRGWTRRCFGDPVKNKLDLNSYIAHGPQSLNAMTLDKAVMHVFYEIALHPEHSKNFKLMAQIHDSIFFQVREGHEYLADEVRKAMEIPVTVKGCDGVSRTFTVPAAIKGGKDGKGAHRWSETE